MYILKKFILAAVPFSAVAALVFGFHIVRVDGGVEIIRKDRLTHEDFYVDVRDFGLADYFYHAPAIRNYLFFEKPYRKLLDLIEEKKSELENAHGTDREPEGFAAKKLKPIEKAIRDWMDTIL